MNDLKVGIFELKLTNKELIDKKDEIKSLIFRNYVPPQKPYTLMLPEHQVIGEE